MALSSEAKTTSLSCIPFSDQDRGETDLSQQVDVYLLVVWALPWLGCSEAQRTPLRGN